MRPVPLQRWLAALSVCLGAAWLPVAAAAEEQVWLDLLRPEGALSGPLALAPVEGWATTGAGGHDVVLVLDVSGSTLLPSGDDVDGDGKVGRKLRSADDPLRSFNPRRLCSDPGDSVRAAEIAAARRFVDALDPDHTRLGLVVFADSAEERAPVGASRERLEAELDRLAREADFGWAATNLAGALDRAGESLAAAAEPVPSAPGAAGRRRWIVILSDGTPNLPGNPRRAADEARARLGGAVDQGIRIHAFALGLQVMEDGQVFREISEATGGRFAWVKRPADVVARLADVDLSGVAEIEVRNASTGEAGRAVRVSPDGRFDGVVPISPGENRIRVTARGPRGSESVTERVVHFDPREADGPEERRAADATLEWLRSRTEALELGLHVERERTQARDVRFEAEGAASEMAADAAPERGDVSAPRP